MFFFWLLLLVVDTKREIKRQVEVKEEEKYIINLIIKAAIKISINVLNNDQIYWLFFYCTPLSLSLFFVISDLYSLFLQGIYFLTKKLRRRRKKNENHIVDHRFLCVVWICCFSFA